MKIQFDNVNFQSGTGPNSFANRLARKLYEMGHEVTFDASADVSLVFIERSGTPLTPKVVQRLDGIWFKPNEYHTKNVRMRDLYHKADGVVFQSEFDKKFVERWWGVRQRSTIIRNGIIIDPVKTLSIDKLQEMRLTYDRMYTCSANWHAQKRLSANVELFKHLRKGVPNSCLIVMGNISHDQMISDPGIFYTGAVDATVYNQVYAVADWMFHLAWADHCPNVVVEALAQGTPVVCGEVGGTKELIGEYGIVLKERAYDYELVDYDDPPSIDVTQVDTLPTRAELNYSSIADINIESVAKRYVELFESL